MAVDVGSALQDTTLLVRNILASGITDPYNAGSRIAQDAKAKFVMTGYPDRKPIYPVITVMANYGEAERLGSYSETMKINLNLDVRVWARNNKERDQLTDAVFRTLKNYQVNSGSGTEVNNIFDFHLTSSGDIDEEGKEGIHSKILRFNYFTV